MARELQYIRTDRNGTKYFYDLNCPRCAGEGSSPNWKFTGLVCFECGGTGLRRRPKLVKEYTDEYAAKLEARRIARIPKETEEEAEARIAREAEEEARRIAERAELEAAEARIRGHYFGEVGQKIEIEVTYTGCACFDKFYGFMTIYKMDTDDGAHLVWKTSGNLGGADTAVDEDTRITIRATIKAHNEYHGIEQTELTRVKVVKGGRKLDA